MMIIVPQQPKFLIDIESMLSLPASVFWKDLRGVYLGCNDVMAELTSISSRQAVIGLDDMTLLGAAVAKQFVDHDRQVLELVSPMVVTEYFRNDQNVLIKGLTTKAPLFDDKGQLMGLWGMSFLQQIETPQNQTLSCREIQCLQRVAKGLSAKAIAMELNLSKRTVESYIDSVKSKLGCTNKTELLIQAIKHQYIEIDTI